MGQFYGSNSEGPYVCLEIIAIALLHHLRGHPAGRAHESMPLLPSLYMCAYSEITQINIAFLVHQNVTRLDVSMYLSLAVEIVESVHNLK